MLHTHFYFFHWCDYQSLITESYNQCHMHLLIDALMLTNWCIVALMLKNYYSCCIVALVLQNYYSLCKMNAWYREQMEQHFFTKIPRENQTTIWIFYFFIQNQQCLIICTRLKRCVSYVRLSFIQSVHRNHPVRIPLVFKVQYFKCSFADIKLGLCQTSSGCCLHPQWHHMHLRIGPGQSIGYRDVCFHRPSGASVFHRH